MSPFAVAVCCRDAGEGGRVGRDDPIAIGGIAVGGPPALGERPGSSDPVLGIRLGVRVRVGVCVRLGVRLCLGGHVGLGVRIGT